MKYINVCSILLLCWVLTASAPADRSAEQPFFVQQLAPGVWAAIHNDKGGHAICNAGIIDLGNQTLIFDCFINPDAAARLKQTAEELTGRPVTYVVNSHYHDDHIRGNQEFSPGTVIISTQKTRERMQVSEPEEQAYAKEHNAAQVIKAKQQYESTTGEAKEEALMWLAYFEAIKQSLPGLHTVLPGVTFQDSLRINGSKNNVLLKEFTNAHTLSDAVLFVPDAGIVFTGDVLFVNRHPWLGDGNPDKLEQYLLQLANDPKLQTYVPGHGPVGDKSQVVRMVRYISEMRQSATEAVKNNIPDSVFIKQEVPAEFKPWWFGRFYKPNLDFFYKQVKGN